MILAAHQPNFLPWLGFFDRMRKADLFVMVDHVQFERQNFQNRTQVKTAEGARWVTVPVHQRSRGERIMEKTIDNQGQGRHGWSRKALLTLKYSYQGLPHYASYAPRFEAVLGRRWERLVDLNVALLELCRGCLGISTPMLRSSSLSVKGAKSDMVLDLCRAVGADTYLAGMGGSRHYLDLESFARAGVKVVFQDFRHPRYAQRPGTEFVAGLSALDLLFNHGPDAERLLRQDATRCTA